MTAVRFAIGLALFSLISSHIGYQELLAAPLIVLALSAACAFLPFGFMIFIAAVVIFGNFWVRSREVAFMVLLVFAIMFFLYFRFTSKKGVYAVLSALLSAMGIPYVLPVAVGLREKPQHAVSVICGSFMYFICRNVGDNITLFSQTGNVDRIDMMTQAGIIMFQQPQVYIYEIAFAAATLVVYVIANRNFRHNREIALVVGIVLQFIMVGGYDIYMNEIGNFLHVTIGCLISLALSYLYLIFTLSLDYARTERVQFEDDEYYYYVKAVPKTSVTVADKQVEKINTPEKNIVTVEKDEIKPPVIPEEAEIPEDAQPPEAEQPENEKDH